MDGWRDHIIKKQELLSLMDYSTFIFDGTFHLSSLMELVIRKVWGNLSWSMAAMRELLLRADFLFLAPLLGGEFVLLLS